MLASKPITFAQTPTPQPFIPTQHLTRLIARDNQRRALERMEDLNLTPLSPISVASSTQQTPYWGDRDINDLLGLAVSLNAPKTVQSFLETAKLQKQQITDYLRQPVLQDCLFSAMINTVNQVRRYGQLLDIFKQAGAIENPEVFELNSPQA
jgi:hypothetical protein